MRKDAKIGFAIGGVLLAVLTVYVIVVPRHRNAISPNAVTLSTPADMPGADASAPPSDNTDTPAKPEIARNTSSDGVNWEKLLNGGGPGTDDAPPLMTVTPGAAAGNGVTVPAAQAGANDPSTPPVTLASNTTPTGPTTKPAAPTTPIMAVADPTPAAARSAMTSGSHQYTIKAGQTLSSIAGEVYGNSRFYVAIIRANPNINPTHLRPGMQIVLPPASEVNPQATPEGAAAERTTAVTGRSYTVKAGDTLYAISKELFGTPRQADAIYELNKQTIGPNEGRLKQGMVLKLPEAASGPTASAR
jgi:nucleoid-associated protein YgaU